MRERLSAAFEEWGRLVLRRPWAAILGMLLLSAIPFSQLPKIRVDASAEKWFDQDDPVLVAYDSYRDRFGRDAFITVAIEPREVFSLEGLAMLASLHADLEAEVPFLTDITSLVNARWSRTEGDELIVGSLQDDWPRTEADVQRFRNRVTSNPLFEHAVISSDERYTMITLRFEAQPMRKADEGALEGFEENGGTPADEGQMLTLAERDERAVAALDSVLARYDARGLDSWAMGTPLQIVRFGDGVWSDVGRFMAIAFLMTGVLLFALFRRVSGTLLPLLVVNLSLPAAMGLAPILGIPAQVGGQVIPTLLLAVGVADSVHILAIFYQRFDAGDAKADAIIHALGHSALPVLMTSFTTAAALASFASSPLAPAKNLGLITSIGVIMALLYTLVLLPAALAVWPFHKRKHAELGMSSLAQSFLLRAADLSTRRPWAVVGVSAVLLAIGIAGALQVRISYDQMRWLPKDDPLVAGDDLFRTALGGSGSFELVLEADRRNAFHEPDLLNRMQKIADHNASFAIGENRISKSTSIVDFVKEINQALNDNDPEHFRIPQERAQVAQELLLFENGASDDLADFADPLMSTARMSLRMGGEVAVWKEFVGKISDVYSEVMGDEARVTITGMSALTLRAFRGVAEGFVRSFSLAILVVAPLMILLFGSFKWGLLSMIPNLTPILLTLGFMHYADIPLDAFTMLIGCIALGISVDDTIHFMHGFRRDYLRSGDAVLAVRHTLETTGRAMLFTTLVLTGAFSVFMLGTLKCSLWFGGLTALTLVIAFVADVTLAPALMVLAIKRRSA